MTIPVPVSLDNHSTALTDRFGRRHNYLRISVTDRCNLRCVYCMPADGLTWQERSEILSFEEIERLAAIFVRHGVDKIRLTGGEPTVRRNIVNLVERLRALPGLKSLLMSTNGVTLAKNATHYRTAGLDGLNISLDTLRPERFAEITLRDHHAAVVEGIHAAIAANFSSIKINVVVIKGVNNDELVDFAAFAAAYPVEVRFIEFMPFDRNEWSTKGVVSYAEMRSQIESVFTLKQIDAGPNAVAKEFAIEGGLGRVGFVTSMTENFCSGCNRLRLTADGKMKNCLFSTGETDLRAHLRGGASDLQITEVIHNCVLGKWIGHPPMEELANLQNRTMIQIGG